MDFDEGEWQERRGRFSKKGNRVYMKEMRTAKEGEECRTTEERRGKLNGFRRTLIQV